MLAPCQCQATEATGWYEDGRMGVPRRHSEGVERGKENGKVGETELFTFPLKKCKNSQMKNMKRKANKKPFLSCKPIAEPNLERGNILQELLSAVSTVDTAVRGWFRFHTEQGSSLHQRRFG